MADRVTLKHIEINGFRPFGHFVADLGPLEVVAGANASGKSSLFEFLRFLRDSMTDEIPPEIIAGSVAREVFHVPGANTFGWRLDITAPNLVGTYTGAVGGPVGQPVVHEEELRGTLDGKDFSLQSHEPELFEVRCVPAPTHVSVETVDRILPMEQSRLTLSQMTGKDQRGLSEVRNVIARWRFYGSLRIAADTVRRSVLIEQEPMLDEDAGNLSAVLHYLMTEHRDAFAEMEEHLRSVIPGFTGLTVKARGGPGEVIAFVREQGVDKGLPLADLSDGVLRLICWIALCVHPNPPPLICVDEPDQGVHPRTLPVLAALFEKASERTQIILATHSSYFLAQFDISRIAVMRKENGEAKFLKPADSAVLKSALEDFGPEEIELMHRTDELERLA
jgi:predicted ATPase